jgi:hypothetical protein
MTDQAEKRGHLNGKQRQLRVEIEEIASIAGWRWTKKLKQ